MLAGGAAITGGGVVAAGVELAGGLTGPVAVAGVLEVVVGGVAARGDAAIGALVLSVRDDEARLTRARRAVATGCRAALAGAWVTRSRAGAAAGVGAGAAGAAGAGLATGAAIAGGAAGAAWAGAARCGALDELMAFRAIPTPMAEAASTAAMAIPIHFGLRCPRSSRRKMAAPAPIPPGVGGVGLCRSVVVMVPYSGDCDAPAAFNGWPSLLFRSPV